MHQNKLQAESLWLVVLPTATVEILHKIAYVLHSWISKLYSYVVLNINGKHWN